MLACLVRLPIGRVGLRIEALTQAFFEVDDAVFTEFEWKLLDGAVAGEGSALLAGCGGGRWHLFGWRRPCGLKRFWRAHLSSGCLDNESVESLLGAQCAGVDAVLASKYAPLRSAGRQPENHPQRHLNPQLYDLTRGPPAYKSDPTSPRRPPGILHSLCHPSDYLQQRGECLRD